MCSLPTPLTLHAVGERTGMDGGMEKHVRDEDFRCLQIAAGIPAALAAASPELTASTAGQGGDTAGGSAGSPCGGTGEAGASPSSASGHS